MSRLKNTKGFTDQFSEILALSENQIKEIDDMEFELYKQSYWNHENPQPNFKFIFIRKVGKLLLPDQWQKLKSYRNKAKVKIRYRKVEKLNKLIELERNRLKDLLLTDDQLERIANHKNEIPNLIRKSRMNDVEQKVDIQQLKAQLEDDLMKEILTSAQLQQYRNIAKDENIKQHEWLVKLSTNRFEHIHKIELNDAQREAIYIIEDKSPSKNEKGEYYSEFEQEKNKLAELIKVLDKNQYATYKVSYDKRISNIIERTKKADERRIIYVTRLNKELEYYKTRILPKTTRIRKELEIRMSDFQKEQVAIVKKEYLKSLNHNYAKAKDYFKRYTKNLAVNEMKEFRIRHMLDLISPNLCHIQNFQPAIKLAKSDITEMIEEKNVKLKEDYEDLKKYQRAVFEETGGEYGGGFRAIIFPTDEEVQIGKLGILLIESEYDANIGRLNAIDNII